MRFYLILFFCVSVFFISCKDKKIPDDVVPIHEMAALLTDIHIVDGSLYEVPQQMDTLTKHGLGMYMAVFKMHHIDTATFKRSITFYSSQPILLDQMYVGIEQRIQRKIDSLQKHKPKEDPKALLKLKLQHKADSLKAVKDRLRLDSIQKTTLKKSRKLPKALKFKRVNALPQ
ncbi:MAG: DUF4296 domain-containing protein [Mucilaginibacter sp.]|uniref:DUF4296 domain-containing protein n=1 Tax=Mucilaginibacter sp. TaxID=1882438 RepID=UPI0032640153